MARTNRFKLLILLSALAFAAAACGGNSAPEEPATTEPTPSEETSSDDAFCEAAEDVVRLDEEIQGITNDFLGDILNSTDGPPPERELREGLKGLQGELTTKLPMIVEAYERLENTAPENLKQDVAMLSDFTVAATEEIAQLESFKEINQLGRALQQLGVKESVQGLFRIDSVTRERCDIVLAD